ncbi:MAG: 2-oxo-4-hydroxy-4-carboxy-5-ureidoimidazoline decarboxylase [Luteolibacter sp.]
MNSLSAERFVGCFGSVFEHSPWVAAGVEPMRPFSSAVQLHSKMVTVVKTATPDQQMSLICGHPDLAGRLTLTAESVREQASAGIGDAGDTILAEMRRLNGAYRERFGFPFIICARLNKVDAIVSAMKRRLLNERDAEIAAALEEIYKIAELRLADLVEKAR